ncbi:unnamed protein product [Caenorhabditis auriculariae]|uniref:Uncharacterized protein n=1 Tax=Caenorhabditis auriculariae TaxID=2777116 RepID=A0A8S1HIU2_9PELO|nr:unnamed protein product [Caenorhabditis auriculariae]
MVHRRLISGENGRTWWQEKEQHQYIPILIQYPPLKTGNKKQAPSRWHPNRVKPNLTEHFDPTPRVGKQPKPSISAPSALFGRRISHTDRQTIELEEEQEHDLFSSSYAFVPLERCRGSSGTKAKSINRGTILISVIISGLALVTYPSLFGTAHNLLRYGVNAKKLQ